MSKFEERDRLVRRVIKAACEIVDRNPACAAKQVTLPRGSSLAERVEQLRKHEAAMLEADRFATQEAT